MMIVENKASHGFLATSPLWVDSSSKTNKENLCKISQKNLKPTILKVSVRLIVLIN